MHNSLLPVNDDQIWKNFVFNEEMTSKMQPATGKCIINREDVGT